MDHAIHQQACNTILFYKTPLLGCSGVFCYNHLMSTDISKTPQFDAFLDMIFETLVPHTRTCKWKGLHEHCQGDFEIVDEDIEFLKMLRVPPPNFCPRCRFIKRNSFYSWVRFFKRPCNAPHHNESVISSVPPLCPFKTVDMDYYVDVFDPIEFGFKPDLQKSIREQFWQLRNAVPCPCLSNRDPSNVNCDYSTGGRDMKNGYYISGCFRSENVWYSSAINNSQDIMDSNFSHSCEQGYGLVRSERVKMSYYTYYAEDCIDCWFLYDCRNCQDCVGGVNLRNKRYVWFGQQLDREEFMKRKKEYLAMPKRSTILQFEKDFWDMVKVEPFRAERSSMSSNYDGVMIRESDDVHSSIATYKAKHVRHCSNVLQHHDSMDVSISGGHSHHLYDTTNVGSQSSDTKFSAQTKFVLGSEFCLSCKHIEYCFMCIGIENKQYCIFNIPYEPEEYWKIVDGLKCKLLQEENYEDGITISYSLQAYNVSVAASVYPLSKEAIEKLGAYYQPETESNVGNLEVVSADDLPETIAEVSDDILTKAIACKTTGRPFKIIATELEFYRRRNLPLPTEHPQIRIDGRTKIGDVLRPYPTHCNNCKKAIDAIIPADRGFNFYCDKCFIQAVE